MERNVGIWIDHERAFVVELRGKEEVRSHLASDVERHTRHHGGGRAKPFRGFFAPSEASADRRRSNQIKSWCREVMESVAQADRIYIIGPGEAKTELLHEMDKSKALSGKVVGVENADQMTENQVAAKVREFYLRETKQVPSYRRPPGT